MKKIFIIGLSLLLVVFGFTSSSYMKSEPVSTTRFMARGIGANSPFIDFTEVYENGKFTKAIINTISDGEKVYDVYKVTNYGRYNSAFAEYTDIYDIKHNYSWVDSCCWWLDVSDFDYHYTLEDGSDGKVTTVQFGPCNCSCDEQDHFVINFITDHKDQFGGYAGTSFITSLTRLE